MSIRCHGRPSSGLETISGAGTVVIAQPVEQVRNSEREGPSAIGSARWIGDVVRLKHR